MVSYLFAWIVLIISGLLLMVIMAEQEIYYPSFSKGLTVLIAWTLILCVFVVSIFEVIQISRCLNGFH